MSSEEQEPIANDNIVSDMPQSNNSENADTKEEYMAKSNNSENADTKDKSNERGDETENQLEKSDDDEEDMLLRWDDDDEQDNNETDKESAANIEKSDTVVTANIEKSDADLDIENETSSNEKELDAAKETSNLEEHTDNIETSDKDLNTAYDTTDKVEDTANISGKIEDISNIKISDKVDINTGGIETSDKTENNVMSDNIEKDTSNEKIGKDKITTDIEMSENIQLDAKIISESVEKVTADNETSADKAKNTANIDISNKELVSAKEIEKDSTNETSDEKENTDKNEKLSDKIDEEIKLNESIIKSYVEHKKLNTDMEVDELNKTDVLSSTTYSDESLQILEHGLKKPDMMLEIPTQELIFCDDDSNVDSPGVWNQNVVIEESEKTEIASESDDRKISGDCTDTNKNVSLVTDDIATIVPIVEKSNKLTDPTVLEKQQLDNEMETDIITLSENSSDKKIETNNEEKTGTDNNPPKHLIDDGVLIKNLDKNLDIESKIDDNDKNLDSKTNQNENLHKNTNESAEQETLQDNNLEKQESQDVLDKVPSLLDKESLEDSNMGNEFNKTKPESTDELCKELEKAINDSSQEVLGETNDNQSKSLTKESSQKPDETIDIQSTSTEENSSKTSDKTIDNQTVSPTEESSSKTSDKTIDNQSTSPTEESSSKTSDKTIDNQAKSPTEESSLKTSDNTIDNQKEQETSDKANENQCIVKESFQEESDKTKDKQKESTQDKINDNKSLMKKSSSANKTYTEIPESENSNKTKENSESSVSMDIDSTEYEQNLPNVDTNIQTSKDISTEDIKLDTSKSAVESTSVDSKESPLLDVQPSTSSGITAVSTEQLAPDTKDELPEVSDSLGLLAESSRVMEDDEEQEDDDDGDDDDEFDPDDESSNQMTAEHSEDSNAQHSEPDSKDQETPITEKEKFTYPVATKTIDKLDKIKEISVENATEKLTAADVEDGTADTSEITTEENNEAGDIETVKLSDTSDTEVDSETTKSISILKDLLCKDDESNNETKKSAVRETLNIVELDESSSECDIQEVSKSVDKPKSSDEKVDNDTQEKPANQQTDSDTGEIKTDVAQNKETDNKEKPVNLEVFNLDSDDEENTTVSKVTETTEADKPREQTKCINGSCESGPGVQYMLADPSTIAYYDAGNKRKAVVCLPCGDKVKERTQDLIKGIKDMTPILDLDMKNLPSDLVEISDSESESEADGDSDTKEKIGESGAKFLEEQLADMINGTWRKYKLDERLEHAHTELNKQLQFLEDECKTIDTLLNECQVSTDKLRNELYATFETERRELSSVIIYENSVVPEKSDLNEIETRAKRRMSSAAELPAKRPAIPLGYTTRDAETKVSNAQDTKTMDTSKVDEDKDVSVVKLSAEAAPADLPPPGTIARPVLRPGLLLFAMRNSFCSWLRARIIEVVNKANSSSGSFTMCRVKFESKVKVCTRVLPARYLAYAEPADVRLTIGTRVIALFKDSSSEETKKELFYSGIVAEIPNPVNNYRYLIFFDDGYAQYVRHNDTRVVCESAQLVWEEVHPFSREFVKQYLLAYPERPMVRLHAGQSLKTEWNGKWWISRVIKVDASLVQVHFEDDRTEWIYRGSTRLAPLYMELQAAERQRSRPLPRSNQRRMNMPYVEYTRSDEQGKDTAAQQAQTAQTNEEIRRQRAVAKKSTTPMGVPLMGMPPMGVPHPAHAPATPNLDSVTSRVVYYTPKNAVKPLKMTTHQCTPKCKRNDVLALKDLRTYNPLAKPLLSGWERQVVRFKGHKEVMYRAPCGRRLRNMLELHMYLQCIQSDMAVDLFDFHPSTHCLAEFVLNKCLVGKKDLSHGKENVPVPCVNYYDESLPEFCSYNTERTPTAGVPLNLDPEFLCGCDCTDDCEDKTKCSCWKMTLEGARTIGLEGHNVGYVYKRLPEPLPSGIYECNSRCKCKQTCLNRVAQHPLQLKLQVFKTYNRGWGIRALNDVPKGAFLCVYAGNLLTDATANLDGLNEGDEYLAELDYIEVVEQMKEGYEEDVPEVDKKLDKAAQKNTSPESSEESSSEEEDNTNDDKEDGDFKPGFIGLGLTDFDKRLRKRDKKKADKEKAANEKGKDIEVKKEMVDEDGCITISDDEEAREPSRFMAQAGMGANEFVSKYKSVRTLFGEDEACYIMDAKVQGNIGRYLNHSCTPNVFVQNVFVDSHDPRFPWVAFFALSHIRAGTELTWNYNYDVGSVPGKVLYCYCGAPNCRGRLL